MLKVIMTKGLPASGKSTWAKRMVDKNKGQYKRVSKDALRMMLDNNKWSGKKESFVLKVRDTLVVEGVKSGWNVIVDDTNLNPIHETRLRELAKEVKAEFEVKDFTDVSLEECIKRDIGRDGAVGEKVIRDMYKQFLKPKPQVRPDTDEDLPKAIICDIDGTLAHMKDRSPFDWKKVGEDEPDFIIWEILLRYRNVQPEKQMQILLVSGRDEVCRPETEEWLGMLDLPYDELWMRPQGDMRKDVVVKEEIYNNHIKDKYNVQFVLDDRDQVVEMWRSLGIKCLQVAEGDF